MRNHEFLCQRCINLLYNWQNILLVWASFSSSVKWVNWAKWLPILSYSSPSCLEVGGACFIKDISLDLSLEECTRVHPQRRIMAERDNNNTEKEEYWERKQNVHLYMYGVLENGEKLRLWVKHTLRCEEIWSCSGRLGWIVKCLGLSFKEFGFNPVCRKSMKIFNPCKLLSELCFRKICLTAILRMDWREEN